MATAYTEYQRKKLEKTQSKTVNVLPAYMPKVQTLPSFLGGGQVDRNAQYPRPQSERDYPITSKTNYERDHNIPFSLGGTNTKQNVSLVDLDIAKKRDNYINNVLNPAVKKGQISKEEAVVKANSYYDDQTKLKRTLILLPKNKYLNKVYCSP